ncbi:MAG TPA: FtsQ-type POTRA domain-containing protein [Mycobacteriales bacterium]|nr:FtsQ-type POTRA domain-containing protein [Mycobacteriales bacterium]
MRREHDGSTASFVAWRRARRLRMLRPALIAVAVVCLLSVGAWVALDSSVFALRKVTIEGLVRLTKQEVLDRAALPGGRSLLRIDPAAIAARIERLPPVAQATVTRRWPHALDIRITERRPVAVVATGGTWVLVDINGVAFATVQSAPTGLVPVRVGAAMADGGTADARSALAVYRSLSPALRRQVVELRASSPASVSFQLHDGRDVVWGSPTDNARKLAVLRALLPRHARHYDVSAPGVAVTS